VNEHSRRSPLDPGVPVLALAESLGLPSAELVKTLVQPPLEITDGRVTESGTPALPAHLERAVDALGVELHDSPFAAPTADRLAELGLDTKAVAAAAKATRLLRLSDGIVLMPGAARQAAQRLAELPQPFTASEARAHLATSRRVVLPLLEYLDKSRITKRLPDDRRVLL
jgi:selenocysteine-specific elongation factor